MGKPSKLPDGFKLGMGGMFQPLDPAIPCDVCGRMTNRIYRYYREAWPPDNTILKVCERCKNQQEVANV